MSGAALSSPDLSAPDLSIPDLSIIVVSYNTRQMTLACLESVLAETREKSFELIVVDNASPDGSAEALASRFPPAGAPGHDPRVRLILEAENHGFARANNLAAREARGKRLLLLNPDTVVLDRALDRLAAFADRVPQARIWGGRTRFADGSLNPSSCWRRQTLWTTFCRTAGLTGLLPNSAIFNAEAYGGWARDSEREVDIVVGCLLLIDRDLWQALEGFDPSYVMYGEEADLCLRARSFGARPRLTPEATIIHHGGASETVRADRVVRILKGKATLIHRHAAPGAREAMIFLYKLWPLTRVWAARALGGLGGRKRESAEVWAEVWKRRGEWAGGY
ncbi:MAG: glycosyltransferase family 2 protein [Pseudomonadota bacterium]